MKLAPPNTVKVVLANNGNALYFSRSPIPYPRDGEVAEYLKHVGVYGFRRDVLADYSNLPQPMLEHAEKLEQLRLMAAGYCIRAYRVEPTGPGVDTPECLEKVRALMSGLPLAALPTLDDVRLVITDVDGVLTDGGIYYDATGECLKRFHVRDGMGMRLLEENGVRVAVLSGRDSATLRKRVADLGITLCQFGVKDKQAACHQLMASRRQCCTNRMHRRRLHRSAGLCSLRFVVRGGRCTGLRKSSCDACVDSCGRYRSISRSCGQYTNCSRQGCRTNHRSRL